MNYEDAYDEIDFSEMYEKALNADDPDKALTYSKAYKELAAAEALKRESKQKVKVTIKDILPLISGFITAGVGIYTASTTMRAANRRTDAELVGTVHTNQSKLEALEFWKKQGEEDIIDDKPIKATNETFR